VSTASCHVPCCRFTGHRRSELSADFADVRRLGYVAGYGWSLRPSSCTVAPMRGQTDAFACLRRGVLRDAPLPGCTPGLVPNKEVISWRPEGLEPPAYWFEASAFREIIDLRRCSLLLMSAHFQ